MILNILARKKDPGLAVTIATPEALRLKHAPAADCARYDSLGRSADGTDNFLALMVKSKLYGMRLPTMRRWAAGIKRQHEPPRIVGDLLKAEIAEEKARPIKYQMTIAKLLLAKDLDWL